MSILSWNNPGERFYEVGVERGVLYPPTGPGVAWNGLINVVEKPSGGAPTPYYMDGLKYLNSPGLEEFTASIEAFTYPAEFAVCDGTASSGKGLNIHQQPRQEFDLTYRTRIGNDVDGIENGYLIHFVYNALAAPTEKKYESINEELDPLTFGWSLTTRAEEIPNRRATAHLTLDSRKTEPYLLKEIERRIYGTTSTDPAMIAAADLANLVDTWNTLTITDNGDGTWTAEGPDDVVYMTSATEFAINWPSAEFISEDTYTVYSL